MEQILSKTQRHYVFLIRNTISLHLVNKLKELVLMTLYMEEMVMTEYLVVLISHMTIKLQVETMLFMEEMEMTQ